MTKNNFEKSARAVRCWEFFHCHPDAKKKCLMAEVGEARCWLVNISCCRMDPKTPYPLSVKKVLCKTCPFYKTFHG